MIRGTQREKWINSNKVYKWLTHRKWFSTLLSLLLLLSPSHVWFVATPWVAALQVSLFITIYQTLLKFMAIESVMPFNHIILCHLLLLIPSVFLSISVFSKESAVLTRWPKYWSFSYSISPSKEYSVLTSIKIDWFDLLETKGFSRVLSSTTVQKHQFFGAQPS